MTDEIKDAAAQGPADAATSSDFCGTPLVDVPTLARHLSATERVPVEVRLLDARVYPDGRVMLARHGRRTRSSMSVRHFEEKLARLYPGLAFKVPVHGRTRMDTARRRFHAVGQQAFLKTT